ncbi:MAG: hypothetical protein M3083_23485 [Actinomycetota bacterium]|nr:hypothetical protein [Actinomycetota bacterium]
MPSELTLSLLIGPGGVPLPVPPEVMESLMSASVTQSASGTSGFDLSFAVSKGSLLLSLLAAGYFDPTTRVILFALTPGTLTVLMDGVITLQELVPSDEPAKSTLSLKGDDLTRMLDLVDLTGFPWAAMPAEVRVTEMVAKYSALYGLVPLVVPSVLMDVPNPTALIPVQRGTDLTYIKTLAAQVGYDFFIQPGPLPGMNLAYWGPVLRTPIPFLAAPPPLAINWDGASNVESLQFSFDGFKKTQWVVWTQLDGEDIPIPVPEVNPISPPLGLKLPPAFKVSTMSGLAKYSAVQAGAIALAKAASTANVVSGRGTLDVLRYGSILPTRTIVDVCGAGIAYDGQYFVESTTHTIKSGSYKQSFTLSRNALIADPLAHLVSAVQSAAGAAVQQLTGLAAPAGAVPLTLPGGVGLVTSPPGPTLPAPVPSAPGNTGRIAALPASP